MTWEEFMEKNRLRMLFVLEEDVRTFLEKLILLETRKCDDFTSLLFEHGNNRYCFEIHPGWSQIPSNTFVQFGTKLLTLTPFFRDFLSILDEVEST